MTDQDGAMGHATLHHARFPTLGLGLSSIMLGTIGFGLFVLPIMGIPVSIAGIAVGIAGILVATAFGGRESLRLSVAGILLSVCGLVAAIAIERATQGYFAPRGVFPEPHPPVDRLYVPPPSPTTNMIWLKAAGGSGLALRPTTSS